MGILPDEAGGAIIVWSDGRSGHPDIFDTHGQRVLADGELAPGWVQDGNLLLTGKANARVAPDGAGGFYVGAAVPGYLPGSDREYYVQRFTLDGVPAPGWPEVGVLACAAPDLRNGLEVAPDGLGGLLLTWWDTRTGAFEIFASRLMADGTLPAGWTPNGTLVSDPLTYDNEFESRVVADGSGGAYVTWEREPRVFVQHLTSQGSVAPGWPVGGIPAGTTQPQFDPQPVGDGSGGAIVVWEERSSGRLCLFAQRVGTDGPVPVQISLASVTAEPDRVVLSWQGVGIGNFVASVYRRSVDGPWQLLGAPQADGADRLRYEDRSVTAGERYAYRLGYLEDGAEQFIAETWVDVPPRFSLALEGFRPNPSAGSPIVAFTLTSSAPATLEVLDVIGRRVLSREVGSLGPGRHLLRLEGDASLAPGVYVIRMRQGGQGRTTRGLLIR